MTEEQRKRWSRLKALQSAFYAATAMLLALVLGLVLFLAVQDHRRIRQNQEIQQFIKKQAIENGRLSELIRSCTTPGKPCAERGRRQTAAAVADINQVVILAAACADRPDVQTRAEIQSCVIEGLAKP